MSILVDDKYLGHATAYAYAKSKGYTGTEEEFAELMASYAEVAIQAAESARQAAQSATTAGQAASSASGSATTANTKAEEAASSAQTASTKASEAAESVERAARSATTASNASETATTKASEASQSASNAASSATTANNAADDATAAKTAAEAAQTAAETAQGKAEEAAEEATTTVANKADKDGIYSDLSVGNVFSDDSYTEDKTPYLYRVSGGGVEVGKVEADTIVGGTVAWNQIYPIHTTFSTPADLTGLTINVANGFIDVTGSTANEGRIQVFPVTRAIPANHVCLMLCDGWNGFSWRRNGFATVEKDYFMNRHNADWDAFAAISVRANTTYNIHARFSSYDLTQMFGSAVADYIYALETATAGAGIAVFRKMFPNAYYPYNAGELMHVSGVSEHVMRGKNLNPNEGVNYTTNDSQRFFMKAGNYVFSTDNGAVIAGTNAVYIQLQNEGGTVITKGGITSTNMQLNGTEQYYFGGQFNSDCAFTLNYDAYVLVGFNNQKPTNFNALQIELGTRATAYEPYREPYTYPLDSSLTLRGIPKLDASNHLYYDGDVYSADGTVQRKYGEVDLGSLTWGYDSNGFMYTNVLASSIKSPSASSDLANIISTIPANTAYKIFTGENGIGVHSNGNLRVRIDNMGTDVTAFRTAMSGVMLVYELATPTEETAEPYTEYQKVSAYGTEEYVSTGIVPVGHVTKYPTDIVSKVDGLPSDFSTLIAPTEKGFTATRAYSVNQFMIINNQLYKATASIANGATITVGTNVTATTIADILTSLLNA